MGNGKVELGLSASLLAGRTTKVSQSCPQVRGMCHVNLENATKGTWEKTAVTQRFCATTWPAGGRLDSCKVGRVVYLRDSVRERKGGDLGYQSKG